MQPFKNEETAADQTDSNACSGCTRKAQAPCEDWCTVNKDKPTLPCTLNTDPLQAKKALKSMCGGGLLKK